MSLLAQSIAGTCRPDIQPRRNKSRPPARFSRCCRPEFSHLILACSSVNSGDCIPTHAKIPRHGIPFYRSHAVSRQSTGASSDLRWPHETWPVSFPLTGIRSTARMGRRGRRAVNCLTFLPQLGKRFHTALASFCSLRFGDWKPRRCAPRAVNAFIRVFRGAMLAGCDLLAHVQIPLVTR